MVSIQHVGVVINVCTCSSTSQEEGGIEEVVLSPLDQLVCRRVVSFVLSVVIICIVFKMAKLFTCLGGSSQLGQITVSITQECNRVMTILYIQSSYLLFY